MKPPPGMRWTAWANCAAFSLRWPMRPIISGTTIRGTDHQTGRHLSEAIKLDGDRK